MWGIETPNTYAQLHFKLLKTHVGVLKHISINIQMWDIETPSACVEFRLTFKPFNRRCRISSGFLFISTLSTTF